MLSSRDVQVHMNWKSGILELGYNNGTKKCVKHYITRTWQLMAVKLLVMSDCCLSTNKYHNVIQKHTSIIISNNKHHGTVHHVRSCYAL